MLYYGPLHSTIAYCNHKKEAVVPFFLTYEVTDFFCNAYLDPRCQKRTAGFLQKPLLPHKADVVSSFLLDLLHRLYHRHTLQ